MHLYFATRGVKHMRDIFVTTMQSQFFPWRRKNLKTKKDETTYVQGALRPIELWEYVFPEENLPQVLAMLEIKNTKGSNVTDFLDAKAVMLRKMLGAKKIPKVKEVERQNVISKTGVSIHPIGIKEDERQDVDWGAPGKYNQEML